MGEARGAQSTATSGHAPPPDDVVVAAYRTARALIDEAEARAVEIVAAAERRARAREQDAELLVGRARRLLEVAEHKAALLVAEARRAGPKVIDLTDAAPPLRVTAPPRVRSGSGVEQLVAAAISQAVDEAFGPRRRATGAATPR